MIHGGKSLEQLIPPAVGIEFAPPIAQIKVRTNSEDRHKEYE